MKAGTDNVLFGAWVQTFDRARVLDAGAGTGLLSLMLAQRFPNCQITAVEMDEGAYHECIQNFRESPWFKRLQCLNQRLQEHIPGEGAYDLIICNPPFHRENVRSPEKVRDFARQEEHLPPESLFEASKYLNPEGIIAILSPANSLANWVAAGFRFGMSLVRTCHFAPVCGKFPNRVMMEFSKKIHETTREEMCIRSEDGKLTEEYKLLTGDFYL